MCSFKRSEWGLCPLKTREWKCVLLKGANVEDDKSEFVLCQGANGKAEWKRYKQYTKDDIVAAIEEVKNGKYSRDLDHVGGEIEKLPEALIPLVDCVSVWPGFKRTVKTSLQGFIKYCFFLKLLGI